jgi:hypothetical protein
MGYEAVIVGKHYLDITTDARGFYPACQNFRSWLLLDSRVVDLPRAYNPTFVMLSYLKPLFFNNLKNEFRFSDNTGA